MKNNYLKIFTLLVVLWMSPYALAQCDNQVSTDPSDPTNSSLPEIEDPSGSGSFVPDERYLNGFDWWTPSNYPLTNMQYNPTQPYGPMSNIQANGSLDDYDYLNKGLGAEIMNPTNGWELLLSNLGRYPDNTTNVSSIDYQTVPYLVFYNRYSGTIRVFVQYGYNTPPNDAINGVKINLKYKTSSDPNNVSGIFRLGEGIDRSLDQTTDVLALTAVVPSNGATNFWMSGDFKVMYDPCVCHFPTDIDLSFEFFSTTDLKLYGRGITVQEPIVDGSGNITNADFLSGIDNSAENAADNGYIMYKKMEDLANDYIKEMEKHDSILMANGQHNEEVKKKLLVIKVFKSIVKLGLTATTGTPAWASLATKLPNLIFDDTKAGATKKKAFYGAVEKILGTKLNTFISEKFAVKTNPTAPTMPTASFTEMNFSGSLYNALDINAPLFHTPGSFVTDPAVQDLPIEEPHGYPIYNDPLGVFALLNTPQVNYSHTNTFLDQTHYDEGGLFDALLHVNTSSNNYQFQLTEALEYTFNPALDIEETEILCSFVIKSKRKDAVSSLELTPGYVDRDPVLNEIRVVHNPAQTTNVFSDEVNVDDYDMLSKLNQGYTTTQGNIIHEDYFYPGEPIDEDNTVVFETVQLPIDAFKKMVSGVGIISQVLGFDWAYLGDNSLGAFPNGTMITGSTSDFEISCKRYL